MLQHPSQLGAGAVDRSSLLGQQAVDITFQIDRDRVGFEAHQALRRFDPVIEDDAGGPAARDLAQELLQGDAGILYSAPGYDHQLAPTQRRQHGQ